MVTMMNFFTRRITDFFNVYIPNLLTFSRYDRLELDEWGWVLVSIHDFVFLLLVALITSFCYYRYFKNRSEDKNNCTNPKKRLNCEISEYKFIFMPWLLIIRNLAITNAIALFIMSFLNFKILDISPYLIYIFSLVIIIYIIRHYKVEAENRIVLKNTGTSQALNNLYANFERVSFGDDNTLINYQKLIDDLPLKDVDFPHVNPITPRDFDTKKITKSDIIKTNIK